MPYVDMVAAEATNANAARLNAMVSLLAIGVVGSVSSASTQRIPERTTPASKSATVQSQSV